MQDVFENIDNETAPLQYAYHSNDKRSLRNFLIQQSAEEGKTNGEQLGLSAEEIELLNADDLWLYDESWVSMVSGVAWNDATPARMTGIDWDNQKLSGDLIFNSCDKLATLLCSNNSIAKLRVLKLKALEVLCCDNNRITDFDFRNNIKLHTLHCGNNQLAVLYLQNNIKLQTLHCGDNRLAALHLQNNQELHTLYCSGNQIKALYLQNNVKLQLLHCGDNRIANLNLSKNTELHTLHCGNNRLTNLNLSKNTELHTLHCGNNRLAELDVSGNKSLKKIVCSKNQLVQLDLPDNDVLEELSCAINQLPFSMLPQIKYGDNYDYTPQCIAGVNVVNAEHEVDLSSEYCIADNITTYRWYDGMTELQKRQYLDINGKFTFTDQSLIGKILVCQMTNDTFPDFADKPLTCKVKVIEDTRIYHDDDKAALRNFLIQYSIEKGKTNGEQLGLDAREIAFFKNKFNWKINEEWIGKLAGITWNDATPKRITDIDWSIKNLSGNLNLSKCSELNRLNCNNNHLFNLNISKNTALQKLYCDGNNFVDLNLKNNIALRTLHCSDSKLTNLDLRENIALTTLYCNSSLLEDLNLRNNTGLLVLYCFNNRLTELDFQNNTELRVVYCNGNQLKSLNLKDCSALQALHCSGNQLESLNLKDCSDLQGLHCANNKIVHLDIMNNSLLKQLNCNNNRLTSLSLLENKLLRRIHCSGNWLARLNVDKLKHLKELYCSGNLLKFSTLPLTRGIHNYHYMPQENIQIYKVLLGSEVDLSSEYEVGDSITAFKWHDGEAELQKSQYTSRSGKFIFTDRSLAGKMLICKMTNAKFPALNDDNPLICEVRIVGGAMIYHDDDKTALRNFLIQPSAEKGKTNGEQLGLSAEEIELLNADNTWLYREDWVNKIAGTGWNKADPKRIISITWLKKNLSGDLILDVCTDLTSLKCNGNNISNLHISGLRNLRTLLCSNNQLADLDLSNCNEFRKLRCSNNRFKFLTLFRKIFNSDYTKPKMIDGGEVAIGQKIDLSIGCHIEDTTTYKWYDGIIEIPENQYTAENGMFVFSSIKFAGKILTCKMTNAVFNNFIGSQVKYAVKIVNTSKGPLNKNIVELVRYRHRRVVAGNAPVRSTEEQDLPDAEHEDVAGNISIKNMAIEKGWRWKE